LTPNWQLELIQEWSDFMKTSNTWNFGTIAGKIMLGLVFVTMVSSIDVTPALGKDNHKRMERHDNGRHRGQRYDRDRYVHDRRVYVAPPVVYVEPPAPGIQIFFPPVYIHP
jgi:hypothetical protein